MSRISPIQYNQVQYILVINGIEELIPEPENWKTAERGFFRNKQYNGVLITVSDAIEFKGMTAQTLNELYKTDGVLADVQIIERTGYEENNTYQEVFSGDLDFSTVTRDDNTFSCKINSDELTTKLQSRWRTEVSFDNEEDLDGNPIDTELDWTSVKMTDRGLNGENQVSIGSAYTMEIEQFDSYERVVLLTSVNDGFYSLTDVRAPSTERQASVDSLFFVNNMNQDVDVTFYVKFIAQSPALVTLVTLVLNLTIYDIVDDGTDITLVEADSFELGRASGTSVYDVVLAVDGSFTYTVEDGQGVELSLYHSSTAVSTYDVEVLEGSVSLVANTSAESSYANVLLPMESFRKITQLMGAHRFESDYLSKSRLAITNGFNIRNVPDKENITYTFQKLFNSYGTIHPLGLDICGNTIRIENLEYYYQKFISHDFGKNVSNVIFSHDSEIGYSEINLGFETSNFNEEGALDEYNVRTVWVSPISIYRKVLNMVSSIQASSYVIETLRRIQYLSTEERTHERRGDSTLFFLDLKDDTDELRKWEDDFEQAPTDITDGEKAYNLRISPMNRLRKLGSWITFGFMKFTDKYLTFSSSTGATEMITQPIGETAKAENDNIQISEIGSARYVNELVTFKIPPMNLSSVLYETENGVKKVYGLFKFEYNDTAYQGYIQSYKPATNEVELKLER